MREDPVPKLLAKATERLLKEFAHLPETPGMTAEAVAGIEAVLERTAERLGDNYPYFHPLYAGQMLKPPHPVARAAYALAMLVNPNNHARDGGRASSAMEIEAVGEIAAMFGWAGEGRTGDYLGHLTSSGTIANLEALWVAGRCSEGPGIRDQGPGTRKAGTKGPRHQGAGKAEEDSGFRAGALHAFANFGGVAAGVRRGAER
jgi:hypothetical protein